MSTAVGRGRPAGSARDQPAVAVREVQLSRPLIDEDRFGMNQLPFVAKLSQSTQDALRAHIAAYQLSQFMHGEQGALMTAAALTHAVPDYEQAGIKINADTRILQSLEGVA